MNITDFMALQRRLQVRMKQTNPSLTGDPAKLEGDELADFMRWNAFALTDEIHEALGEVGWKPWATSRHVNHPQFMQEMVDAFHFFLNMLLAGAGQAGMTIEEYARAFEQQYITKNAKNLERQQLGYDGVTGKCANCRRDLEEVGDAEIVTYYREDGEILHFCRLTCSDEHHQRTPKEGHEHLRP